MGHRLLCNPLNHIVFSYGAILPTGLAARVPRSLKEAKTLPDWPEWPGKIAHEKEFNAIEAQGTYVWVTKPPNTHIHRCHELFDIKTDNFGNPLKRKCRLVLQGNTQKYGESYFDVYAPVTTPEAIRILFAVATQRDWGLRQFEFFYCISKCTTRGRNLCPWESKILTVLVVFGV